MDQDRITYFAETDFRNERKRFGIKAKDRTRHMYVIGKTGMGKSTLLENMAIQDIQNGEGLAFMDPHGGTAEKLLDYVPEHRIKDVVYFAPFDTDFPISFNVMEDVGADKRHLVVNGLMATFEKIWADAWSARMAYILQNTLLALLEYPGSTLLGVNRMYVDKEFRKKVVDNIQDAAVKSFWVDEYAKYTDRYAQEATPAIQNKIGQFASNPLIRNIIGQAKSSFDIRDMMDKKKILIINLSKGRVGEGNARLLGSMLITKIYLAAMSRADMSADTLSQSPNFYLYVDEFQSFANKSFADILSEARKYKLNLTIAHQYVEQMEEEVRDAVFGNVGTMITFRVGSYDAEIFEKEFAPQFTSEDIVNLGQFQMYLRLMIGGVGSKPFSARAMAPIAMAEQSFKQEIIEWSRAHNAVPRANAEKEIIEWHAPIAPPQRTSPISSPARGEVPSPRGAGEGVKKLANTLYPPNAPQNMAQTQTTPTPSSTRRGAEHHAPAAISPPFEGGVPEERGGFRKPKPNFPFKDKIKQVGGLTEKKPPAARPAAKPSPAMQNILKKLEEPVSPPFEGGVPEGRGGSSFSTKEVKPSSLNNLKEVLARAGVQPVAKTPSQPSPAKGKESDKEIAPDDLKKFLNKNS